MSDRTITLRLLPQGFSVLVRVHGGERLLDVLDELGPLASGLPTACRAGNCAACLVRVIDGEASLAPVESREADTLRELGHRELRLGCQMRLAAAVKAGAEITLQVLGATASIAGSRN